MIIQRLFSEKKKSEKSKASKSIDTALEIGGLASLGYGSSALSQTGKKNRIANKQAYKKGFKKSARETLAKDFLGQAGVMKNDPILATKMSEWAEKENKSIPKRAAEGARKLDKKMLAKNKKAAKVSLGLSSGLLGARAVKGAIDKKKAKKDDNSKK